MAREADDAPFFSQHLRARASGERRDPRLFPDLLAALGVDTADLGPVLGVVGSKGKGTATAAASQLLSSQAKQIVSVSSPHYVYARERLRINGMAIDRRTYRQLSEEISHTLLSMPHLMNSPSGYLSPSARFLAAACLLCLRIDADYLVVEAGVGGWSDELSWLPIEVLACTTVFSEHQAALGPRLVDIAADKLYPGFSKQVSVIVVGDLPDDCAPILRDLRKGGKLVKKSFPVMTGYYCDPFGPANAGVGYMAARELMNLRMTDIEFESSMVNLFAQLNLPARNQLIEAGTRRYVVNSAATEAGIVAGLEHAVARYGTPDGLVLCVPDDRNPRKLRMHLSGYDIVWAYSAEEKFNYARTCPRVGSEAILQAERGQMLYVSGVVSFAGEALDLLSASESCLSWW